MTLQPNSQPESDLSEDMAKLHLDSATGEMVSKSELKRRMKHREKEASKTSDQPAPEQPDHEQPESKPKKTEDESLDPRQFYELQLRKLKHMKESGVNPFPHIFYVDTTVYDFRVAYQSCSRIEKNGSLLRQDSVSVAGRVYAKRASGSKLIFYQMRESGDRVQIVAQAQESVLGEAEFVALHDSIHRGDIIGVVGMPMRTNTGALSIMAKEFTRLTPCLHMLPTEHFGLKDQEVRYRQRYLDMIMNESVQCRFIYRTKIIKYIRNFLEDYDFMEVETPILNNIPGGAAAKPFITHHNDLNKDMFLRIAPELFLKQLVIGGFDRVFEIGKQFRNEGIDLTHNPEFTTCEAYWAFADYEDWMDKTENLISGIAEYICGSTEVKYHMDGPENPPVTIDFSAPFRRVSLIDGLESVLGITFPPATEMHTEEYRAFLDELCRQNNVECAEPRTAVRLLDKLVGEFIEATCINPTFIIDHPKIMSPLAKSHRSRPGLCERFELFIATKELVNSYTELNDPVEQRERFLEQAKDKAAGDDEAMFMDEAFCTALEYGLPPTAGWGIGIDRLTMLLTDTNNIKEVLPFPAMKPVDSK